MFTDQVDDNGCVRDGSFTEKLNQPDETEYFPGFSTADYVDNQGQRDAYHDNQNTHNEVQLSL